MRTHTRAELSSVSKVLKAAHKEGFALNWEEVAERAGTGRRTVGILKALEKDGRAQMFGKDAVGPGWIYIQPTRNPSSSKAVKEAKDAALRWYQDPALVTEAKELVGYEAPQAFVDIGTIVSLCYRSNKFDGKMRDWEHEFTRKRRLLVSRDGSTMIVDPPFQFTKQGIKG